MKMKPSPLRPKVRLLKILERIGIILLGFLLLGCETTHLRMLSTQMTVEEYLQYCKQQKGKTVEYYDMKSKKIIFSKEIK